MSSMPGLINLAGLVAGGLSELGEGLNLHYVDHEAFALEVADFVAEQNSHLQGKQARKVKQAAFVAAMKDCRAFARVTRDLLKPVLGYGFTQNWEALGFAKGLRVPERVSRVNPMMQAIRGYLTANPTMENAAANVTAARATQLFNALDAAQQALAAHEVTTATRKVSRDAKAKAVRNRISQLAKELTNVLSPVDPRWLRFGLNQPGSLQTPDVPGKVSLVLASNNALTVGWQKSARAGYYRIWVKVKDRDMEFVPAGNSSDLTFTIEDLPAGAEVEVAVSAVNNGGESARSEVTKVNTL